jgi:hypothetical protein
MTVSGKSSLAWGLRNRKRPDGSYDFVLQTSPFIYRWWDDGHGNDPIDFKDKIASYSGENPVMTDPDTTLV